MNPPNVYDVTIPRSQRTHNTTKIVQSIVAIPISQEVRVYGACAAPEDHIWFFQRADSSRLEYRCLYT